MRIFRYIWSSFAFSLHTFLSVEDGSSVCQKLIVFLKLFTRERLYFFLKTRNCLHKLINFPFVFAAWLRLYSHAEESQLCLNRSRKDTFLVNLQIIYRWIIISISFLISLRWAIHIINPVDKTKLSCNTPYRRSTTHYKCFRLIFVVKTDTTMCHSSQA